MKVTGQVVVPEREQHGSTAAEMHEGSNGQKAWELGGGMVTCHPHQQMRACSPAAIGIK